MTAFGCAASMSLAGSALVACVQEHKNNSKSIEKVDFTLPPLFSAGSGSSPFAGIGIAGAVFFYNRTRKVSALKSHSEFDVDYLR